MDLDQNNERENVIENNNMIDVGFPLTKGWALKGNQKLGNRDGTRIKRDLKSILERFFYMKIKEVKKE
ncbi:45868_t:CDS:2 [Gigaspora margarita]|uniref:45868_t:CDS:1 n=1 Tax=Gigaspora margarita TaxID=4874 RepID=A0ABN7UGE7_GIGMA|nr:45868_t:CDS:2 [Gigaspora margarita]